MRIVIPVTCVFVLSVSIASAQIPQIEREALFSLFDATNGHGWRMNTQWLGPVGTECDWYGVDCSEGHVVGLLLADNLLDGSIPQDLENLSHLQTLDFDTNYLRGTIPQGLANLPDLEWLILQYNELSGSIPPQLGSLSNLVVLGLQENQLTGSIPAQLGDLSNLQYLSLNNNQLDGAIPPTLGYLANLRGLGLGWNRLSGNLPAALGNLAALQDLFLCSNRLQGDLPLELLQLSSLRDGSGIDFRWNALYSDDPTLVAFLNSKQVQGDWQSSQTIAPDGLWVQWVGDHTIWLSWNAVTYSAAGGYSLYVAPSSGGPLTLAGRTVSKDELGLPATGLDPGVSYDLAVASYSLPHSHNDNVVESEATDPVMASTSELGCAMPVIEVTWGDPATLSVVGSFDSYVWNTGATSPSISVSPSLRRFYWVTVTAPGPCRESAAILVDQIIFEDGFEDGNTSAWQVPRPKNHNLAAVRQ